MENLMHRIKKWYSEIKEQIKDNNTIMRYEGIENKMRRLEGKNRALDYCSDSGCLMIFTKKYSKLMDEEDRMQPLSLSAMRRQSERLKKYL